MVGNPTRIAPREGYDGRNEQQARSSIETRIRGNEATLDNEIRLYAETLTLSNGANSDILMPNVARFIRITGPSSSFSITGFQGGYEVKRITLYNTTAQSMTITNDATSTAANRILTLTGANVTLPGTSIAHFIYSVSDLRWVLEGVSADGDQTELASIQAQVTAAQAQLTALDNATSGTNTGDQNVRGFLGGLTLSRAGASTLGIAAGQAVDGAQGAMMSLAAFTKTTSAWALGTGNGGLDTGTIANATWYHVWLIQRSDTLAVDVLLSVSPTAPTMPASYDRKRRIGAVLTNGSAQIVDFQQAGDVFTWDIPVADVSATAPGTSAVTRTLSVPTGVVVLPISTWKLNNVTTAGPAVLITSLAQTDTTPTAALSHFVCGNNGAGAYSQATLSTIPTNTSAQVRSRQSASGASDVFMAVTHGWIDRRGRDD